MTLARVMGVNWRTSLATATLIGSPFGTEASISGRALAPLQGWVCAALPSPAGWAIDLRAFSAAAAARGRAIFAQQPIGPEPLWQIPFSEEAGENAPA